VTAELLVLSERMMTAVMADVAKTLAAAYVARSVMCRSETPAPLLKYIELTS